MTALTAIRKKLVLVADDDPFYQEVANAALRGAGYAVEQAVNGEDVLAKLAAGAVDVALLDLTMPVLNGFEVLERLRREPATRYLPVIVITGSDDRGSITRAFQAGANSFLVKPLNWALLAHHVEYVMRSSRTEIELRDAMHTADFLSRLKSNVMNVLGREFRKPLQVVRGHAQRISAHASSTPAPVENHRLGEELVAAGDQMDRVLLKMLHFGHALADGLRLDERKVPIKAFVREALDRVEEKAKQREVSVLAEIDLDGPVDIVCDPSLVGQAIKCLIENAVTFSRRGGQVTVRAHVGRGTEFCLTVEESAPPLSKELLRQIFDTPEPLLHGPGDDRVLGRDVGLSISRILAEAHQGSLGINAGAGEGNLAMLALPPSRVMLGANK